MSKKAIIAIGKSVTQIENAVLALQQKAFVAPQDISVLIPNGGSTPGIGTINTTKAPEGATTGAVAGGLLGGALGVLVGIGALAIPGLGAFIAAGPLLAGLSGAAAGAATGGVVGALVGLGIPEYEAKAYEDRIKAGGYLLAVHVADHTDASTIRDILEVNHLEQVSAVAEK